ncbi:hypothetical protein [Sphingomonas sp. 3-13AW]|uniref:hypothetical protein n=1 Tax=Sphingomonas sp. 3-13AW TaxID=3050450 RepID=UPI003BB77B7E
MSHALRALFEVGQSTHRPAVVSQGLLDWVADQGRVVIVRLTLDYCPLTDATLPSPSRRIETTADDADHALSLLSELYDQEEQSCSDDRFEIWDRHGKIPAPVDPTAPFAIAPF